MTENGFVLNLKVIPNAKKFQLVGYDPTFNCLKIKTKSLALQNKANIEIVKELKKVFHSRITIISGLKSREKKIFVEAAHAAIQKVISQLCNSVLL